MTFPFEENYVTNIEVEVPDAQALSDYTPRTLADELALPEVPTSVSLELTATQYRKIISSLFTGAWYVYPDEWLEVLASFWQGVKLDTINNCDDVANCIETSDATIQALIQAMTNAGFSPTSGDNPPVPTSTAQSGANLLPDGYTCDNDHIWGLSLWLVETLHEGIIQMLEVLEVATNDLELAAVFGDNVEGVSWFASGLELAAWIQDQFIEYYESAYSVSVQRDLACAIYCIAQEDCELSIDDLLAAYDSNVVSTPASPDDWLALLEWLITSEFVGGIETVATVHYFLLQALRYSGELFESYVGVNGLKQLVSFGKNQTDPDWDIYCTDCPTELPVLVVGEWSCDWGAQAGTVEQQSASVWRVSSAARAGDKAVTFKSTSGDRFRITSSAKISGSNVAFRGWCSSGTPTSGGGGVPLGVDAESYVLTVASGATNFVYDITVEWS